MGVLPVLEGYLVERVLRVPAESVDVLLRELHPRGPPDTPIAVEQQALDGGAPLVDRMLHVRQNLSLEMDPLQWHPVLVRQGCDQLPKFAPAGYPRVGVRELR